MLKYFSNKKLLICLFGGAKNHTALKWSWQYIPGSVCPPYNIVRFVSSFSDVPHDNVVVSRTSGELTVVTWSPLDTFDTPCVTLEPEQELCTDQSDVGESKIS